jgi:hypothetical protein
MEGFDMPVYFANDGEIDLDVIRVMGVSVKDNDSPIGYFGTGLKFSIATLLRTGHKIFLTVGGKSIEFTSSAETIRGRPFDVCYMGDERLPFTTELGKDWEVWQAYRELHSNTLDENGEISDKKLTRDTVFEVQGSAIEKEYAGRHSIFLSSEQIASCAGLTVHPGRTTNIYYRGVRAGSLPEASRFTYNITSSMELSEDRLLKSMWDVEYNLETKIPTCDSEEVFSGLIGNTDTWDANLNFSICGNPSDTFIEVAKRFRSDANANPSVLKMVEKEMQKSGTFPDCEITEGEVTQIRKSFKLLRHLNCDLKMSDLNFCETLGESVCGIYHHDKDKIFIARSTICMGDLFLAAVLYEEWVHKVHKLKDNSRQLQSFLLHKLISCVANSGETDCEIIEKG